MGWRRAGDLPGFAFRRARRGRVSAGFPCPPNLQPVPTSSRSRPWPRRCRRPCSSPTQKVGSSTSIPIGAVHRPFREQTLGGGWTDAFHPDDAAAALAAWRTAGAPQPVLQYRGRCRSAGGGSAMGALAGRADRSPSAEIIAWIASAAISTNAAARRKKAGCGRRGSRPWCARRRPSSSSWTKPAPAEGPTRPGANSSARPWTILADRSWTVAVHPDERARSPRPGPMRSAPVVRWTSRPVNGASPPSPIAGSRPMSCR